MTTTEALKACINAMGITDELDEALRKTMLDILNRVQEKIEKAEPEQTEPKPEPKRRGRPKKVAEEAEA